MSVEHALDQLKLAVAYGAKTWCTSFDPIPGDGYYLELFQRIREAGLQIGCCFEIWSLPAAPIIKEFEMYKLSQENQELFQNVKLLIQKYKFDDAGKLL